MNDELRQSLDRVAQRFRRFRLWSGLTLCWLCGALIGLILLAAFPGLGWRAPATLALGAILAGCVVALQTIRSARDHRWVARQIEKTHTDLNAGLLAAVEEDAGGRPGHGPGYLRTAVIQAAIAHAKSHDWGLAVPDRAIAAAKLSHAAAVVLLLATVGTLAVRAYSDANDPEAILDAMAFSVSVEPGDAQVEKGGSLLVVAKFDGRVPPDATLVVAEGPNAGARVAMTRSLEDPTFAGRVDPVNADLTYRIEFRGQASPDFRIKVFEYPELLRADATLDFPSFANLPRKVVEDVRRLTAVEGTEVGLLLRLNKEVTGARLVDEEGGVVDLAREEEDARSYRANLRLADTHRYRVELVDREGRSSKQPAELVLNVTRNRPPTLTLTRPSRDVRVSPVEELALAAKAQDDYGVVRRGVSYAFGGGEPVDVALEGPEKPAKSLDLAHLIDFEAMKAEPDQLLTYFVWAEDLGPDGNPRRASSDMFFAEVRHFEEIFRQGEQPPGGSAQSEGQRSQNAQESEQLAELQKQIINATWKIVRRETRTTPTETYAADVTTLRDSQRAA
ncbi:MAG: hypothetical protein AB7I30_09640, partial [Isosphaeraceae bacterium]